ncbi:hypothetical protein D3C87_1096170 [compost metagenome]
MALRPLRLHRTIVECDAAAVALREDPESARSRGLDGVACRLEDRGRFARACVRVETDGVSTPRFQLKIRQLRAGPVYADHAIGIGTLSQNARGRSALRRHHQVVCRTDILVQQNAAAVRAGRMDVGGALQHGFAQAQHVQAIRRLARRTDAQGRPWGGSEFALDRCRIRQAIAQFDATRILAARGLHIKSPA